VRKEPGRSNIPGGQRRVHTINVHDVDRTNVPDVGPARVGSTARALGGGRSLRRAKVLWFDRNGYCLLRLHNRSLASCHKAFQRVRRISSVGKCSLQGLEV
jgi:hypothetical protein